DMGNAGVALNRGALALALVWLTAFRDDIPRPAVFLLKFVAVTAALSLVLVPLSWVPIEKVPAPLLILMPSRLLNVNVLIAAALVLGIVGVYRDSIWSRVLTVVLVGGLLIGPQSMLWDVLGRDEESAWLHRSDPMLALEIAAVGVLCLRLTRWKS